MSEIRFVQNLDDTIEILKSAARWREAHGILYSPIWDPKLVGRESYLDEFYADQAYVLYLDGKPTATATLADPKKSKLETWKEKLGEAYFRPDTLYVDDLAVIGQMIGQGIIALLFEEIEGFAKAHRYASLRLDIDARLGKLAEVYGAYSFAEVARRDVGSRVSVFMERLLPAD